MRRFDPFVLSVSKGSELVILESNNDDIGHHHDCYRCKGRDFSGLCLHLGTRKDVGHAASSFLKNCTYFERVEPISDALGFSQVYFALSTTA